MLIVHILVMVMINVMNLQCGVGYLLNQRRSLAVLSKVRSKPQRFLLRAKAKAVAGDKTAVIKSIVSQPAQVVKKRVVTAPRFHKAEGKVAQSDPFLLSFTVFGEPVALARHRVARGIMYNPSVNMQRNFASVCSHLLPFEPFEGVIQAEMHFYFSRPKSHYGTGKNAGKLKDGQAIYHNKRADLDNLVKFVLDALNKQAYLDDSQIAAITCKKMYCETPRIEVKMTELDSSSLLPNSDPNDGSQA